MAWAIEYTDTARKQLRKLESQAARRILQFMEERVAPLDCPQDLGKALTGELGGLWRYRVGDYRIVTELQGEVLTVLVIRIGHRREIYR